MSRSGLYEAEHDSREAVLAYGRWRAATKSAINGKRGQKFIRELLDTLNAMPEKKLIDNELQTESGDVCAIGSVLKARGIDTTDIDVDDYEWIAGELDINEKIVQEIEYINDCEGWRRVFIPYNGLFEVRSFFCPYERHKLMVNWCERHLKHDT